jgi:cytochrome b561
MADASIRQKDAPQAYHLTSKTLHWLMAIGFFLMLSTGLYMEYADISKGLQFRLYQWHKSGGVLLLLAIVFRVLARMIFAGPPPMADLSTFDARAAKIAHKILYALMIVIPISGWFMVSASVFGLPTIVFGWFEWPHIPGIQGNTSIEDFARGIHWVLTWSFGLVIAVHIAGAIKHQVIEKKDILSRMSLRKKV